MPTRFVRRRWRRLLLAIAEHRFFSGERATATNDLTLSELKTLCVDVVHDLPAGQRLDLVRRIGSSRDPRDLWFLRSCFFRAISLQYGEHEARRRMARLDTRLVA
jgi:hypothetical protein